METEKVVHYWLTTAADDLIAAEHLFQSGDYCHALFFAHLYLEKLLKARVVQKSGEHAPLSHSLRYLAERAQLHLTPEQVAFLVRVAEYSIKVRYPDMELEFKRQWTKELCASELAQIKEFGVWIEKTML